METEKLRMNSSTVIQQIFLCIVTLRIWSQGKILAAEESHIHPLDGPVQLKRWMNTNHPRIMIEINNVVDQLEEKNQDKPRLVTIIEHLNLRRKLGFYQSTLDNSDMDASAKRSEAFHPLKEANFVTDFKLLSEVNTFQSVNRRRTDLSDNENELSSKITNGDTTEENNDSSDPFTTKSVLTSNIVDENSRDGNFHLTMIDSVLLMIMFSSGFVMCWFCAERQFQSKLRS